MKTTKFLILLCVCTLLCESVGAADISKTANIGKWNSTCGTNNSNNTTIQNRYIFAGNFSWLTKQGAQNLIRRIKRAGFNVLVPAVWKGRGAGWPTTKVRAEMKWIKAGIDSKHDPLAYLIEIAHKENIEVHPWFTLSKRQANFMPRFHDTGTPDNFYNIHNEEFQSLIVDLIGEVTNNYDVDGINLDYVRSGGICESLLCRIKYAEETGNSLIVDKSIINTSSVAKNRIEKWNKGAIDKLVRNVTRDIRQIKPGLLISIDTHIDVPQLKIQGVNTYQWLNEEVVDLVFHMQYLSVNNADLNRISNLRSKLLKPDRLVLLVGNFSFSTRRKEGRKVIQLPGLTVADYIYRGQKFSMSGNGVGLFEYSILTDEQIEEIRRGPFLVKANSLNYCRYQ